MVAGPVHALDTLVSIDDLEDLTDEGTGLLGRILARGGGQSTQGLSSAPDAPASSNSVRRLTGHTRTYGHLYIAVQNISYQNYMATLWV